MVGADCNRQFVKLHFHERDPVADKFIVTNVHTGSFFEFSKCLSRGFRLSFE